MVAESGAAAEWFMQPLPAGHAWRQLMLARLSARWQVVGVVNPAMVLAADCFRLKLQQAGWPCGVWTCAVMPTPQSWVAHHKADPAMAVLRLSSGLQHPPPEPVPSKSRAACPEEHSRCTALGAASSCYGTPTPNLQPPTLTPEPPIGLVQVWARRAAGRHHGRLGGGLPQDRAGAADHVHAAAGQAARPAHLLPQRGRALLRRGPPVHAPQGGCSLAYSKVPDEMQG